MDEPREIELKLEPDSNGVEDLVRRLSESIGTPRDISKRLKATYFDTRKQALRRRGLSLRIRDERGQLTQTLKATNGAGTFDRAEWQSDADGGSPDPDRFREKTPRKVLKARGALRPLFVTNVDRTIWDVQHGASKIEVAFDRGEIKADGAVCPLAEIELELKNGSAADLFGLALQLAEIDPLRIGVQSKSERGYALLEHDLHAAVKAEPIELTSDLRAGEAFRIIARSCLRQFRLNESVLARTRDADALHQARVAIRRLRSAFSIFKDVVADGKAETIRRELKELSTILGEARNLDVHRAHVIAPELERNPDLDLRTYDRRIGQERETAYDKVLAKFEAPAFRTFMLELAAWIETGSWSSAGNTLADQSLMTFVPRVMKKRTRTILKKGRHLDRVSATERHKVRIAAKKLRYASEFFRTLVRKKRALRSHDAFIKGLEQLQETLGALNDIHTGRETAEQIANATQADAATYAFPAGLVTGEQQVKGDDLILSSVATYNVFSKSKSPLTKAS